MKNKKHKLDLKKMDSGSPERRYSTLRSWHERMLNNAIFMTEMSLEMRERVQQGEKYASQLRNLATKASRTVATMANSMNDFVQLSQKLANASLRHLEASSKVICDPGLENLGQQYERLVAILDREILAREDDANFLSLDRANNCPTISERLHNLEARQRLDVEQNSLKNCPSSRSLRSEFDEKYPDNWSKDSVISLGNLQNLPTVPEDVFTSFSKPVRTSSLSSLKSIRKVKLFLQRTMTSEDEESECDDHELSASDDPTSSSEGGETRSVALSVKKVGGLCNIKEETPQESLK